GAEVRHGRRARPGAPREARRLRRLQGRLTTGGATEGADERRFLDRLRAALTDRAPLAPPARAAPAARPAPPLSRYAVAFSGGLDSPALLAGLSRIADADADADVGALRALHVDHGLHPDSAEWARHCERVCA